MTTSASLTALVVAAGVSGLGAVPRWRGLFDEEAWALADAFRRLAPETPAAHAIARLPAPLLVGLLETIFVPGMAHHYLFRKRLIEDEVRRAVARGARQLLVLGGGFDGAGLRMARCFPELTVVEVDLPRTQARKRHVLMEIGHPIPHNCRFVAADLARQSLDDLLASTGATRPELPTLVVIEGVLMYLEEPDVRALFTSLRRIFPGELSVVFGAIAVPDAEGPPGLRLVNRLLAMGDEGTAWCCPAHRMAAFVAPLGYTLARSVTYGALQREHRSPAETRRVPEEDENYYVVTGA
ncbi:MAG: SAM-dependent methyltransferase [Myxococcaceae bacterium]|nr:MAG: SAM-dependent methyltransferase [Myxococcaceae bacterium]